MKLFRKKSPPAVDSFKTRVQEFWKWFESESENIFDLVSSGEAPELLTEMMVPQFESLGSGFGWVFGPGEEGGHSLTLTPEGVLSHQFLADFWRHCAPKLAGWTFYSSRQRSRDLEGCGLRINDQDITADDLWIRLTPDSENERIDIEVWHAAFDGIPEEARYQILFLLLDEALGEHGTSSLIGEISIVDAKPPSSMALTDFRAAALAIFDQCDWTPAVPAETYSLLMLEPIKGDFVRSDILTISSSYPNLVIEYLSNGGAIDDPVAENGAAFVFLDIPRSYFPDGRETEVRGVIEDTICERLETAQSGLLIGGSTGQLAMYSDFVLFDGASSIEIVRNAMVELDLPSGSSLNYFGGSRQAFVL